MTPSSEHSFRVTAWLGTPALGPWTLNGPMTSRFAWVPFAGVGRLTVNRDGAVSFTPSGLLKSLWRVRDVQPVEVHGSYTRVLEVGPSSLGGNTIYNPVLGSLLARVVFLRDPDYVELQIGVKNREALLTVLDEHGWNVTRYTKTIWPWEHRANDA